MLKAFVKTVILMALAAAIGGVPTARAAGQVGTGTPASCTQAALVSALAGGGLVTFNCGGGAVTITLSSPLNISANTTIDGGGLITLRGAGANRLITITTTGTTAVTLNLQNITLSHGRASGSGENANGAGIWLRNQSVNWDYPPTLNAVGVVFDDNVSTLTSFSSGHAYDFGGGAIFALGGYVSVSSSTFTNNHAHNGAGGAIHILNSNLTVADSVFTGSSALGSVPANSQGGAIYIDGTKDTNAHVQITGSTFTGSRAYNSGGAIYFNLYHTTQTFTVAGCTFTDNRVSGGSGALGGAISGGGTTNPPVVRILNSTFANNQARRSAAPYDGSGGALAFAQRATITIANSTFTNNRADGSSYNANGGAIYITNNPTAFQIINSTIANNSAGWVGGGIVNGGLNGTTTPGGIIRNTILANNTADNGGNGWNIQQHCAAIDVGGSVIPPLTNGGGNFQYPGKQTSNWNDTVCASSITIADPLLGPLQNNGGGTQTMALAASSPAVDAGSNATCAAAPVNNADQRGQTRPIDGNGDLNAVCDSGAFELVPNQPPFAPALTAPAAGAVLTGSGLTFTWQPAPFAVSYRVQADDDPAFGSPALDVSGLTGTSHTAAFVPVGSYHWRVQAINPFGTAWSAARAFTLNSAATAAPLRVYVTSAPFTLRWSAVSWAASYTLEVDDETSFASPVVQQTGLSATLRAHTLTLPGGIYHWRVRACRADGGCAAWSATDSFVVHGS